MSIPMFRLKLSKFSLYFSNFWKYRLRKSENIIKLVNERKKSSSLSKNEEKQAPFYKDNVQVKYLIDQYRQEQKSRKRRGFDINDVFDRM